LPIDRRLWRVEPFANFTYRAIALYSQRLNVLPLSQCSLTSDGKVYFSQKFVCKHAINRVVI
jgi:hypothetical protein